MPCIRSGKYVTIRYTPNKHEDPHVHLGLHCGLCNEAFAIYKDKVCIIPGSGFNKQTFEKLLNNWVIYSGVAEKCEHIDNDPKMRRLGRMPDAVPGQYSFHRIPCHQLGAYNRPFPREKYTLRQLMRFAFSVPQNPAKTARWRTCSVKSCDKVLSRAETATVHRSCLENLEWLRKEPNLLKKLWYTLVWQTPWRGAPPNFLPVAEKTMTVHGLSLASRAVGNPFFGNISLEMAYMIHEHCTGSPFWVLVREFSLWHTVKQLGYNHQQPVPLNSVVSWSRSGVLELVETELLWNPDGPSQPPRFVCITINTSGITDITSDDEKRAPFIYEPEGDLAYVYIERTSARGVSLIINGHLARLEHPLGHSGFPIWDSSSPPHFNVLEEVVVDQEDTTGMSKYEMPVVAPRAWDHARVIFRDCGICGVDDFPGMRYYSVDLIPGAVGITFLYSDPLGLVAIHPHTTLSGPVKVPSGVSPDSLVYIYMPMPPGEEILKVTTQVGALTWGRTSPPHFTVCIAHAERPPPPARKSSQQKRQFHMRLAGKVSIGPRYNPSFDRMTVFALEGLVYNRTELGHANFIAADSRYLILEQDPHSRRKERHSGRKPEVAPEAFGPAPGIVPFFAFAPLRNVVRVSTYCLPGELSITRGILFDYSDGATHAIGQLRLGMQPLAKYVYPRRICICRDQTDAVRVDEIPYSKKTKIECGRSIKHRHAEGVWECHDMDGVMNFFFSNHSEQALLIRDLVDGETWPTNRFNFEY
ncbi:hypothetical protein AK830_g11313 [Neonectria ditissima]|uniref:Uncharacterized protein n=1 Tax=Neonectria ditissima TaxID=78410 RepID=A0A0P7B8D6_9HYPO|nr:hypothetical protein AK830_g11313 [Neonectria ditissima]